MAKLNLNFQKLENNYLFYLVNKKTDEYKAANPDKKVIKLGVGDVLLPLNKAVITALHRAVDDQSRKETFRGYLYELGCDFLRKAISDDYRERGINVDAEEVFVTDGALGELWNILGLFESGNKVLVMEPAYPAYAELNIIAGNEVIYVDANEENGFLPEPDNSIDGDLIYICSPNNPTGAAYDHTGLKKWVDYAISHNAYIIYDAAYEAFAMDSDLPRSIFEIEGARKCAVEICSYSKTAGFTGTRCGYTIVPKTLVKNGISLYDMWVRDRMTKTNGVSYVIQRGAEAVYTAEGQKQIRESIAYYKENSRIIMDALQSLGIWYTGGKNAPYIWMRCPFNMDSWEFFDWLLENANVVGTPGEGFGKHGKKYFRLSAFSSHEETKEAMERIKQVIGKER